MMGRVRALVLLLSAAALGGCNTEFPNPFDEENSTVAPPASASLVFASNLHDMRVGAPRELFAADADGRNPARLTFCNTTGRACDTLEAAPGPDRRRMALRRITRDNDGDGRLTSADGESVLIVDLERSAQGMLTLEWLAQDRSRRRPTAISAIDWAPSSEILVYGATGEGDIEDLFRTTPRPDPNIEQTRNLTFSAKVRERRARVDPTASVAAIERIGETGMGEIWVFLTTTSQSRVTQAGPPGEPLLGTPYRVGADADPDYSPDGRSLVFRRLTAAGSAGLGTWDLLTVRTDGSGLAVIATGPRFRGAPDWGPRGIVFNEIDLEDGTSSLVVLQPDGSGRRPILTAPATVALDFPRWLP